MQAQHYMGQFSECIHSSFPWAPTRNYWSQYYKEEEDLFLDSGSPWPMDLSRKQSYKQIMIQIGKCNGLDALQVLWEPRNRAIESTRINLGTLNLNRWERFGYTKWGRTHSSLEMLCVRVCAHTLMYMYGCLCFGGFGKRKFKKLKQFSIAQRYTTG